MRTPSGAESLGFCQRPDLYDIGFGQRFALSDGLQYLGAVAQVESTRVRPGV